MSARARFWAGVCFDQGNRGRVRLVQHWTAPGAAACELHKVRAALTVARDQGRGLRAAGLRAWDETALTQGRRGGLLTARDLLYHLRQARRAGVLRVRVPA